MAINFKVTKSQEDKRPGVPMPHVRKASENNRVLHISTLGNNTLTLANLT